MPLYYKKISIIFVVILDLTNFAAEIGLDEELYDRYSKRKTGLSYYAYALRLAEKGIAEHGDENNYEKAEMYLFKSMGFDDIPSPRMPMTADQESSGKISRKIPHRLSKDGMVIAPTRAERVQVFPNRELGIVYYYWGRREKTNRQLEKAKNLFQAAKENLKLSKNQFPTKRAVDYLNLAIRDSNFSVDRVEAQFDSLEYRVSKKDAFQPLQGNISIKECSLHLEVRGIAISSPYVQQVLVNGTLVELSESEHKKKEPSSIFEEDIFLFEELPVVISGVPRKKPKTKPRIFKKYEPEFFEVIPDKKYSSVEFTHDVPLAPGNNHLEIKAFDAFSQEITQTFKVYLDPSDCKKDCNNPECNPPVFTLFPSIDKVSLQATDESGLRKFRVYYFNNEGQETLPFAPIKLKTGTNWHREPLWISDFPDNETIFLSAEDEFGNSSTGEIQVITYDVKNDDLETEINPPGQENPPFLFLKEPSRGLIQGNLNSANPKLTYTPFPNESGYDFFIIQTNEFKSFILGIVKIEGTSEYGNISPIITQINDLSRADIEDTTVTLPISEYRPGQEIKVTLLAREPQGDPEPILLTNFGELKISEEREQIHGVDRRFTFFYNPIVNQFGIHALNFTLRNHHGEIDSLNVRLDLRPSRKTFKTPKLEVVGYTESELENGIYTNLDTFGFNLHLFSFDPINQSIEIFWNGLPIFLPPVQEIELKTGECIVPITIEDIHPENFVCIRIKSANENFNGMDCAESDLGFYVFKTEAPSLQPKYRMHTGLFTPSANDLLGKEAPHSQSNQ